MDSWPGSGSGGRGLWRARGSCMWATAPHILYCLVEHDWLCLPQSDALAAASGILIHSAELFLMVFIILGIRYVGCLQISLNVSLSWGIGSSGPVRYDQGLRRVTDKSRSEVKFASKCLRIAYPTRYSVELNIRGPAPPSPIKSPRPRPSIR